jgi:hypothetical protein
MIDVTEQRQRRGEHEMATVTTWNELMCLSRSLKLNEEEEVCRVGFWEIDDQ